MEMSIRVSAFDQRGITVIPPTLAAFDELARPLIGRVADIGLKLKPMLAIVANDSDRTVVSFSKTWTVRYPGGRKHVLRSHTSAPEHVCGDRLIATNPEALSPGTKRVETANLVIQGYAKADPYYDQFLQQFIDEKDRILTDAEELLIEVDTVIFEDGEIIGADRDGWLSTLFADYVAAKQTWYRQILKQLEAGASVDEAYAPIRAFQEERRPQRLGGQRPRFADGELWRTQAAAEAQQWRRRVSDEELPALLKRSIRLEPFVVRRSTTTAH